MSSSSKDNNPSQDDNDKDSNNKDNNNKKKRPLTAEGLRPQKKFYRQRAHCNPLSHNDAFEYPINPSAMDWTKEFFPGMPVGTTPTVLDVGCGFGGLTLALAKILPDKVIMGMEIRAKVTEYVRLRIVNARRENPGQYQNCSVMRTNSMKFLPNYFARAALDKLFFCFPDPHFKRKNHPRRIISERLLTEYAYLLKPGVGRLYCITDVLELHEWHVAKCDAHPLFQRLEGSDVEHDPCVQAIKTETEEGQKVARNKGNKYHAVYQRIAQCDAASVMTAENFFPDVIVAQEEDAKEKIDTTKEMPSK